MKVLITQALRQAATLTLENPNDDPIALFEQIRPILGILASLCIDKETQIITGKTRGGKKGDSLYFVILRRNVELDLELIDVIKRLKNKALDHMVWTKIGIQMFIWAPYSV